MPWSRRSPWRLKKTARECIPGFALVEANLDTPAPFGILHPLQHEERAFDAANFAERDVKAVLAGIRLEDEKRRREIMNKPGCSPCDRPAVDPIYFETYKRYQAKERAVSDPTTLILVDEADRLQMNSFEQMRSIFDEGTADMVLIGMPGIEKRVARFPQFYSRIGFVHEFRPLDATQVQELLEKGWTPAGVTLPEEQLIPEVVASLIRMTGGSFRLLTRLLTQIERVLNVNDLHMVSTAVVEAARVQPGDLARMTPDTPKLF
jgi:AAA domain-containing protein